MYTQTNYTNKSIFTNTPQNLNNTKKIQNPSQNTGNLTIKPLKPSVCPKNIHIWIYQNIQDPMDNTIKKTRKKHSLEKQTFADHNYNLYTSIKKTKLSTTKGIFNQYTKTSKTGINPTAQYNSKKFFNQNPPQESQ